MRPEYDAICFVADVPKCNCVENIYRIDVWIGRLVRRKGVVVPINDGDHASAKNRLHGFCLRGCDAHGDEALPFAPGDSASWTKMVQCSSGKMYEFDGGTRVDYRRMQRRCLGNERYRSGGISVRLLM